MGKHPFGVTYKEDGSLWHNKVEYQNYGDGYEEGDVVRVLLSKQHIISFQVNGKTHGKPFSLKAAALASGGNGEPLLACQPYMGGAAMLMT